MEKTIELLQQRRIWAGLIGFIAFASTLFNLGLDLDIEFLTDNLTSFGVALASLIQAVLALWSYFKPKK